MLHMHPSSISDENSTSSCDHGTETPGNSHVSEMRRRTRSIEIDNDGSCVFPKHVLTLPQGIGVVQKHVRIPKDGWILVDIDSLD